jgi:hypothetical protein
MKKYLLRNKLTGFFFNGTNFSAESPFGRFSNGEGIAADAGSAAVILTGEQNEIAIRSIWGENAQVIEVSEAQLELFKQSANCHARAGTNFRRGVQLQEQSGIRYAAPYFSAATRLRTRGNRLACEAYSGFPKVGRAA